MVDQAQQNLREALKRVAVALKRTGIPFALIGGYAVWARGGPEPDHDVDFMVAATDADIELSRKALWGTSALLQEAGFTVEHPPEDWLFKVFTDDSMVDVIFRDSGDAAERAVVEEADELEVLSVEMPVLSATRLMVQKLNAMDEHLCDFAVLLPVARALREQVDWERVRTEIADNDFAVAFMFLLDRLGVA